MLGSPARTAVVTATLPQISVVYLVFKGSSFMILARFWSLLVLLLLPVFKE